MSKTIFEWAKQYCGDPDSHIVRGEIIVALMAEDGLRPEHRVLDVGCGALSQGKPLIECLHPGNYVGLDPNGWLMEAALQEWPHLRSRYPEFQYASDFTVSDGPYDVVVAHSVLSHVAHWQMEQALVNIRKAVDEGAKWYASLRIDQYDHYARHWTYPGVSFFEIRTVKVVGWHAGWHVQLLPEWKEAIIAECPNDFHDWIRLTAIPTSERMNQLRLDEERDRIRDEDIMRRARDLYEQAEAERIADLEKDADV